MRNENDILKNKGVDIYRRPGGAIARVPILPMNEADDWLELTDDLIEMEQKIAAESGTARDLKRAYNRRLLEIVCAYSEHLDIDIVEAEATAQEISEAFWRLKEVTDPFDGVQRLAQKRVMEQMNPFMAMPDKVLEMAAEVGFNESRRQTSSESQETSPEREACGTSETDGHTNDSGSTQ